MDMDHVSKETRPGRTERVRPARRPRRAGQARAAFTLVEVMVVVIIIGVLAALVAPRLFRNVDTAKVNATKANASTLKSAVNQFMMECRPVRSSDRLREVLYDGPPPDVPQGSWEPYIQSEEDLLDAWGNQFVLEVPGTRNIDFDIVSYGADGEPGGEGVNADIRK